MKPAPRSLHVAPLLAATAGLWLQASASAQSAQFSNPTDTVKVFGETVLGASFTIEAVLMRQSAEGGSNRVFGEQLDSQEDKGFSVSASGIGGSVWSGACNPSGLGTSTTVPVGEWHHVAFVRDGGAFTIYIDGQVSLTGPASCPSFNAAGGNMAIGAFPYTFQAYVQPSFIGRIDWFRVSSVARYTAPFAVPCEPASDNATVMLFKFNDPPGTTNPVDSGPSHFNATVGTGFPDATSPVFGFPANPAATAVIDQSAGVVCPGGGANFSVTATGGAPLFYQWQLETAPGQWLSLGNDPAPLPCGGNASFAYAAPINSPAVTIGSHGCPGPFNVRCLVTSACGTVASSPARLFISPADIGRQGGVPGSDGVHDNNDFVVFIDDFFNSRPEADVGATGGVLGSDGQFNNNDFVSFIDLFFGDC
jgi:hypothetical protein